MQSFFKYITDMKRLPFVALFVVLAVSFFAFKSSLAFNNQPPGKYEEIMRRLNQMISYLHFSPKAIDDNLSQKVLVKYLEDLDGEKNIFLKSDSANLANKYAKRIDDELNGAEVESFKVISKVFDERFKQSEAWTREILSKPFDFTLKEDVQMEGKMLAYPHDEMQRKDRWRKKLKFYALERYVELLDERTSNKGKKGFVVKSDAELEKEARAKTDTVINRVFLRYKAKSSEEEYFNRFINTITNTMDPHTEFLPPAEKRYFDETMSGSFFGIGAVLQYTDGGIKINSVNPGSPAAKSNMIQAGDLITKVAQGDGPSVDMVGFTTEDAVKLIRGKEGTIVTLTIKKPDATIKVVKLKRAKIENVETFARSAIIKDSIKNSKIGVIYLSEFYNDFENPVNGRKSYVDVAKEIDKLKAEKVDGIIMDLRWNGGGSLMDVVRMVGFFIDQGPVVQVKGRGNASDVLRDDDNKVRYSGPLAVMVNEFSASASEIFAAAIQDYGRGVIVGSTSTFGKGTVQGQLGLDGKNRFDPFNSELGSLKLTQKKFYRISGGSTQLKGVESDIILPTQVEALKFREKDNEYALPYDEIAKATYKSWQAPYDLNTIKRLSQQRIASDSTFNIIRSNTEWLAAEADKTNSLNIEDYMKEKKLIKAKADQVNKVLRLKEKLAVSLLPQEKDLYKDDKGRQERTNQWLRGLSEDIYLNQTVKVVEDMIGAGGLAKNEN